jgi:hypothetical protein
MERQQHSVAGGVDVGLDVGEPEPDGSLKGGMVFSRPSSENPRCAIRIGVGTCR